MPATSIITLTTDFGESDYYVGAMKGVILSINPDAQIVDLSHEIRPHDILDAAFLISRAYRYFPAPLQSSLISKVVSSLAQLMCEQPQKRTHVNRLL